jgi:hypothetical protein
MDSAHEEKIIFIFPKHFLFITKVEINLGKILRVLMEIFLEVDWNIWNNFCI